jgi:RHS repeat-associated protein
MGIYEGVAGPTVRTGPPSLKENTIFGSERIGVFKRDTGKSGGYALYELTDHLGNVRAVIQKTSAGILAITNKTDYYPFGEPMPNKTTTDGLYRYAFQGQELDTETNMEAFQLRLWDGRIGRWLSPDPYGQYHSPYLGMGNNPISSIDPDGGFAVGSGDPPKSWFGRMFSSIGNFLGITPEPMMYGELKEVVVYSKHNSKPNTISCNPCSNSPNDAFDFLNDLNFLNVPFEWLKNRQSGSIEYGGTLKTDFIGDNIGKNGFLYPTYGSMASPGIQSSTKIRVMAILNNAQKDLNHTRKIANSLNSDGNISIQSYKYIDTVPVLTPRMGTYGTKLHGYKLVERTGLMSISGNDTLKLNR